MKLTNRVSQNYWEQLIQLMPSISVTNFQKNKVNSGSAKKLFSIWKDDKNKISNNTYKRPITMSVSDVDVLQQEGLVKLIGDKIEITKKGNSIIRIMILGDERSAFDDSGSIIDHDIALANTKTPSMKSAKIASRHENMWWSRFDLSGTNEDG